jgi:hypothetical protein
MRKALHENRYAIFPVLLACYSVLTLAIQNVRIAGRVEQVGAALLIAAAVGLLAWLVSGVLTRDADRRVLAAIVMVAWFAGYAIAAEALRNAGVPGTLVLPLTALLLAAGVALIVRDRTRIVSAAKLVRTATLILLVFPAFAAVTAFADQRERAGESELTRGSPAAAAAGDMPSIYLIVLDKYSSGRALRENHGHDNTPFEERLRERGFVVPRAARSNYPHTRMTLATMLNWSYLDEILGPDTEPTALNLNGPIEENRTWQFLRERGYEFVFFPTTFGATHRNRFADRVLPAERAPRGLNIGAAWLASTALQPIEVLLAAARPAGASAGSSRFPYPIETPDMMLAKFEALAALAPEPGPRFVFLHLLVPHEPYMFAADCSPREPYWPASDFVTDREPIRRAYVEQVQCVNELLEDAVDRLLASATVPPIILLQADHGHGFITMNPLRGEQLHFSQLEAAQIAERTEVFAAYYLPGDGDSSIYESITPVNLLPAIFNHYFDAGLPLKEDRTYWAKLHPPVELKRIN